MFLGILFFIISHICFAITNSLWKNPQKQVGVLSIIAARSFATASFLGIIVFFRGEIWLLPKEYLLRTMLFCCINYFGLFFYLQSLKEKQVSEITALGKFSVLIGIFIGIFYYDEPLTPAGLFAILAILISIILIELWQDKSKIRWNKSFVYAILSPIFWSSSFLFKESISHLGHWNFTFVLEATVCVLSGVALLFSKEKFSVKPLFTTYKIEYFFLVLLGFIAILCSNYSLHTLPVVVSALLGLTYPLCTLLFARFYHQERLSKMQWIGIIVGIIGVLIYHILS